jgi:hypothetical protein
MYVLSKYNYLFFFPIRTAKKFGGSKDIAIDDHNILRPKPTFYHMINITGLFVIWVLAIFICGIYQSTATTLTSGGAIGFAFFVAILASAAVCGVTKLMYKMYEDNLKRAIEGYYEDQERKSKIPLKTADKWSTVKMD